MATQTTNYGLTKPSYNETADIGVINSNMDIIDAKMKAIENKAGSGGTSVTIDSELSTTSENPVQNKVITQELSKKGTYSKPTGGIPKTDLANEVQTSLGKADTALQEHQDISGKAEKTEVTALFNSISDEWNPLITYAVGQYCIHNNILWKCLVANTNIEPTEGTHWKKVSVANEITSLNSSLGSLGSCELISHYDYNTWKEVIVKNINNYKFIAIIMENYVGRSYGSAIYPIEYFKTKTDAQNCISLEVYTDTRNYSSVYYSSDTSIYHMGINNTEKTLSSKIYGIK